MTARIARVFVAVAALGLAAAGPAAAQGGDLRVAIPWTPENLDPTMNLASIRSQVGVSLFDSLVGRDGEGKIVGELAESWRALDDKTWQLKLRRGVVFHNGEPFNAEAVRFTFQRVLNPEQKSPNRATISEVERVDVVDDLTVNLVLKSAYAPFLARLIDFPMVPPKYTAEKGNSGLALRPVGTGPFRFAALVKDDHMVVEAFDRHWRGPPRVRRVIYKPIPEPFTRAAALRNGEVDLITTVPPNLAAELEKAPGIRVQRVPSTWQIYLGLNAFRKPLSDARVRQALNYATDVDAIIKNVMDGNGRRQEGPFTPNVFGFDPSVKGYAPDAARARRLLAEAGYPDGLDIVLDAPAGRYQGDKEIAEALGASGRRPGSGPRCRWRSGAPTSRSTSASRCRTPTFSASAAPCRTPTSSTTWFPRRAVDSTTRTSAWTSCSTRGGPRPIPPAGGRSTPTSRGPWSRTRRGCSSCSRWISMPPVIVSSGRPAPTSGCSSTARPLNSSGLASRSRRRGERIHDGSRA